MSLLSYNELVKLVEQGVINAPLENINSTSIDLTLDDVLMVESGNNDSIDYRKVELAIKDKVGMSRFDMTKNRLVMGENVESDPHCYLLLPGDFVLARSREVFNLPNNISVEYMLTQFMPKNGLGCINSGWCEAGSTNSQLTFELKNMTQNHILVLRPKIKIGQAVFFRHDPVPKMRVFKASW